jgi:hypothetical protein
VIWEDRDRDGIRGRTEKGIEGITAALYVYTKIETEDGEEAYDWRPVKKPPEALPGGEYPGTWITATDENGIYTAVTDENGNYSFAVDPANFGAVYKKDGDTGAVIDTAFDSGFLDVLKYRVLVAKDSFEKPEDHRYSQYKKGDDPKVDSDFLTGAHFEEENAGLQRYSVSATVAELLEDENLAFSFEDHVFADEDDDGKLSDFTSILAAIAVDGGIMPKYIPVVNIEPSPSPSPSPSEEPSDGGGDDDGGGDGDDDDKPIDEPLTTDRPPHVPPPPEMPGTVNVPTDDPYVYIVADGNGTPIGEWRWRPEEDVWIFEEYVPQTSFPQTGDGILRYLPAFAVSAAAIVILLATRRKKRRTKDNGAGEAREKDEK